MQRRLPTLGVLILAVTALGADWPGFRGPTRDGLSKESGLPIKWGAEENVVWKTKLPGPGSSSPIVIKDRVFVTCYSGYGSKGGDVANLRRHLLCIDRKTGKVLWQKDVAPVLPENDFNRYINEHGYVSSTPATDGERVFVYFGRTGVLAFDFDGKQLWQTEVGTALNSWGSGSSPLLYRDLVIVNATVESGALVALDKKTGKQVWKAKGIRDCWSSPVLVELPGGKHEVVLNAPSIVLGFDPDKGEQLWECEGISTATASSTPVTRDGIIYLMGAGFDGRQVMAVRAGGKGDVTKTHILWKQPKAGANHCSPVLHGDRLYYISGQVWCLKTDSGEIVFQERLYTAGQEYVSPVLVDGKIIAFTRRNGAYVLATGDKLVQLGHNDLGDRSIFNGSPAVSDGRLFVRSDEYLYCLGNKK